MQTAKPAPDEAHQAHHAASTARATSLPSRRHPWSVKPGRMSALQTVGRLLQTCPMIARPMNDRVTASQWVSLLGGVCLLCATPLISLGQTPSRRPRAPATPPTVVFIPPCVAAYNAGFDNLNLKFQGVFDKELKSLRAQSGLDPAGQSAAIATLEREIMQFKPPVGSIERGLPFSARMRPYTAIYLKELASLHATCLKAFDQEIISARAKLNDPLVKELRASKEKFTGHNWKVATWTFKMAPDFQETMVRYLNSDGSAAGSSVWSVTTGGIVVTITADFSNVRAGAIETWQISDDGLTFKGTSATGKPMEGRRTS